MAAKKRTRSLPVAEFPTRDKPVRVYAPTKSVAYFKVTWYEPGKTGQQSSTYGKVEADAVAFAADWAAKLTLAQQSPKAERQFVSVAELVDAYLDPDNHRKWKAQRTPEKAGDLATKFVTAEFRAMVCRNVTDEHVQALLDRAKRSDPTDERPLSRSYLSDGRAFLTALVNFGVRHGYFVPSQLVGSYELPDVLEDELDDLDVVPHGEYDEESDTFRVNRLELPSWHRIRLIAEAMTDPVHWLLVMFAASTGMRFGELAALRWSDFNVRTREVRVVRKVSETNRGVQKLELPKGRKRRLTTYPEWLAEAVEARVEAARVEEAAAVATGQATVLDGQTGLMFPAPKGGWIRRSNFHSRSWTAARDQVEWRKGWTFHTLRHCAAVDMLFEAKMNEQDVCDALGHHDISVTQRIYLQAREGSTARMAAATASPVPPWERTTGSGETAA